MNKKGQLGWDWVGIIFVILCVVALFSFFAYSIERSSEALDQACREIGHIEHKTIEEADHCLTNSGTYTPVHIYNCQGFYEENCQIQEIHYKGETE